MSTSFEVFSPSNLVQNLHDQPRYDRSLNSAPSEFPSSFESQNDYEKWYEGAFFWAAIFCIVGIATTLFLLVGYVVACCRRNKRRGQKDQNEKNSVTVDGGDEASTSNPEGREPENPETPANDEEVYNKTFYKVTLCLCVIYFILGVMLFVPVTNIFGDSVDRGLDSVEMVQDVLKDVQENGDSGVSNLESIEKDVQSLEGDESSEVKAILENFRVRLQGPRRSLADGVDTADDFDGRLNNFVSDGRSISEDVASTAAFVYVGLICFTIFVFVLTLMPSKCCPIAYDVCGVPLNLLFLFLLWMVTGCYFSMAIMSADYCMDPTTNTLNIFESSVGEESTTTRSVSYYLQCSPFATEDISKDDGLRWEIHSAVNRTEIIVNEKYDETFQTLEESGANETTLEEFRTFNETLRRVLGDVREIDDSVSCINLRKPWNNFLKAFCEDFLEDGLVVMFGIQTSMALLVFFIMLFGWSFTTRHPSGPWKGRYTTDQCKPDSSIHTSIDKEKLKAACQTDSTKKVCKILGDNVDVNKIFWDGNTTPIHVASSHGSINTLRTLATNYGGSVTARNTNQDAPIHLAAYNGHKDIVKELVQRFDVNPGSKNADGHSPLHIAAAKGYFELVKILIEELDVNPMTVDVNGKYPVDLANENKHTDIANYLGSLTGMTQSEVAVAVSPKSQSHDHQVENQPAQETWANHESKSDLRPKVDVGQEPGLSNVGQNLELPIGGQEPDLSPIWLIKVGGTVLKKEQERLFEFKTKRAQRCVDYRHKNGELKGTIPAQYIQSVSERNCKGYFRLNTGDFHDGGFLLRTISDSDYARFKQAVHYLIQLEKNP